MIALSFGAGRIGIYPEGKPDNMGWMKGSDDGRAAELSTTMGFPSWSSLVRPCFERNSSRDDLYEMNDVGFEEWPGRRLNTEEDYDVVCSRAEIWVGITEEDHVALVNLLQWKNKRARWGEGCYGVTTQN